jgi:hypothetical protein
MVTCGTLKNKAQKACAVLGFGRYGDKGVERRADAISRPR